MTRRPLPLIWIGASSALLCVVGIELYIDYIPSVADGALSAPRPGSIMPYAPPKKDKFEEISARPVFEQIRRPRQTQAALPPLSAGGVQSTSFPNMALEGIILSPEGNVALMRKPNTVERIVLREGEMIDGWRVDAIGAEVVTFKRGDQNHKIALVHGNP